MPITDFEAFDRLCARHGVIDAYYDIAGGHHVANLAAKQSILMAMQVAAQNDNEVRHSLEAVETHDWQTIVEPVVVFQHGDTPSPIRLNLNSSQIDQSIKWQIVEENGNELIGEWSFEAQQAVDQHSIDNQPVMQLEIHLPLLSNSGYHQLSLILADGSRAHSLLIITPESCYLPADIEAGKKSWGINLQLYALRSRRNWGIGDFTDLKNAIAMLAPMGLDFIGLNPLHALFPHLPENASPYSPSSRIFINPVYLDIEAIDEFANSSEARQRLSNSRFQTRLTSLRESGLVDYSGVWAVKMELLKLLYQQFCDDSRNTASERLKSFRQFQSAQGDNLARFALFEALQAYFFQQDASITRWQLWPEDYQNPDSNTVRQWAADNRQAIEFHQYLQWQADEQLSDLKQTSAKLGLSIGMYNDLAVGDEVFSAQCWAEQSQYAMSVGIGAPPDDFNLLGQNWGLPPQIPQTIIDNRYRLFIDTLRANMRHAGALRIDHVMGLMRLYWVPENRPATEGTYVAYPYEALFAIVALESQRNHCLIIGEDLGTVTDEVRHQLWLKKVFSYRVLLFEKDWHHGQFKPPGDYPPYAICTSGSHDLPPLKSFWSGSDLAIRDSLKLYPSNDIKQRQLEARERERSEIKLALLNEQLIDQAECDDQGTELNSDLFLAIQRFLASSESRLMSVTLEDLLSQSAQMNLPGTIDEYPNWRHKISIDIEDWLTQSELQHYAEVLGRERETTNRA